MLERPRQLPADLLRTLLAVSETESVSRASRQLGISQPAVHAHIAHLEKILGGPLIETARSGRVATRLGQLVLDASRKLLDASERASGITGAKNGDEIRIGVSSIFIEKFASEVGDLCADELVVSTSVCTELVQSFMNRKLDVVMALDVRDHREQLGRHIVDEHPVEMVWVKTAEFVSHPAHPIPMAFWPGDGLAVRTLDGAGSSYRKMFSSNDYFAKLSAVRSGRYISMMPRNAMKSPFIEATDERLPALPRTSALIAVRGERGSARMRRITAKLATSHY